MTRTEKLHRMREDIKHQEDVVWKARVDIPTWGGRSFYVDLCYEENKLNKMKSHYARYKRATLKGAEGWR